MMRLFFSIFTAIMMPTLLYALSPDREITQYIHESWIDKDGLPVNTIVAVTQTPDGYLWLATEEGLVRFDGLRFITYTEENTPALPGRHVLRLLVDRKGRLWVGTYSGVAYLENGVFKRPDAKELQGITIFGFLEERDGTLWITTSNGLYALRDLTITRYGTEAGFPDNDIQMPQVDRENTLWVVSGRKHLCRFKPGTAPECNDYNEMIRSFRIDIHDRFWIGTYTRLLIKEGTNLHTVTIDDGTPLFADHLYEDRDGNLWIGSRELELVKVTQQGKRYESDRKNDRIGPVMALFEDRERNLWIGTGGNGLHRFSDSKITVYGSKNGIESEIILPVHRSRDNDIIFGSYTGMLYTLRDRRITPLPGVRELTERAMILTVMEDHDGSLWIGTQGHGLFRIAKDGTPERFELPLEGKVIPAVYEDKKQNIWILVRGEGALRWDGTKFDHFTVKEGLPDNYVKLLREMSDGELWVASQTGGMAVFRGGRFVPFEQAAGRDLPSRSIQTIYGDSMGLLWISTNGNGLFVWDGEALTPVRFKEGITSSLVFGILEDRAGNLWMSSNRGILRVERNEIGMFLRGIVPGLAPLIFTTSHGLKSAECVGGTQLNADRGRNGKLYFATVGGLAVIDPDNLPTNTVRPPVLIEQLIVNNEPLKGGDDASYNFERGIERLEIRYTALSFINPSYITFKYKLNGFDRDWITAGTTRSAHYTNLEPGNYSFTVLAANSDGIWNETGASIPLTIRPLFYQTTYFNLVVMAILALLVYLLFLVRIRTERTQNRRLGALVEEKTRELTNANETLREMSLIDPLTGLRNRRYFTEILKGEATSYLRARSRVAVGLDQRNIDHEKVWGVFLLDIDYFKQVNDRFGHDSGDAILTQFAALLKSSVRADDVVMRWGGEEFLIVLKNSVPDYLPAYAEKVRLLIQNAFLRTTQGDLIRKTVSIGSAQFPFYPANPERMSIEQTVSVADLGLYHAKRNGRNRAVQIEAGGRIADTAPEEMQKMLADLDASVKNGFFTIVER
ncbi:MAG TPA: two-component regulator propeller domain-containing protein [bacterium]|nr:two-component regulator propeller domain-containing protein [bacterium]